MAVFKCKMCGGSLEVAENMTVCECEYCGTQQTLPKTDNEQNLNLFNRANHFRQQCEFDKAAEIYERMAQNSDSTDSELYWSLVLCRYGIEYVDDPLTRKKIPTCHRTQFKSILEDPDYLTALQYADFVQRDLYEKEAQYIDTVQKGILEISNKEKPFDVFICYKETDENGRRTQDSVLAQDLYYGLEREGFKVFFSRITLESKLGTEYEPYIFAALNSAKVMVVIGTKPEYFNAVWVRNEWSRYLMLMQKDRNRILIPAYKDMNPYDLPDALSMFQAQDMSKLGFMQDLIRGIRKIAKNEPEKTVVQQTVVQTPVNSNVENLLKRGNLCLEDRKWQEAENFFEQVLNENVEEYRAYIGKLCAELKVRNEQALVTLQKDFTGSDNYQKACRFGGDAVQQRLFEYNQQGLYDFALKTLNQATDRQTCEKAKEIFSSLAKFKDSAQKAQECEQKALQIEYDYALSQMNRAVSSLDFRNVKQLFVQLGDFKDSAQKVQECEQKTKEIAEKEELDRKLSIYRRAVRLMENGTIGDFEEAVEVFGEISGFQDADTLQQECLTKIDEIKAKQEEVARQRMAAQAKKKKITIISTASVVALALVTVFVIVPSVKYSKANKMLEAGNYTEAEQAFSALGNFKDSSNKMLEAIEKIRDSLPMVTLAVGDYHTVGLKSDRIVVAVGKNDDGQCNVSAWNSIIAISAGDDHTVGLKSDGTVVAVGRNNDGQCKVSGWSDIVAISAGVSHTVGLKSDGTVIAVGENKYGQCDVSDWRDIVAISAGEYHTVGLKADGTVVAVGRNTYGQCDVSDWNNIVAISAGGSCTVGLKADGTVVAIGGNGYGQCNVSDWNNIVAISAGDYHTVGLKADGTAVAVGRNGNGQCNVSDWSDIVAISAGDDYTVGLKADGTVVAVGRNTYGQCDVSGWTDIKTTK